MRSLIAAFLCAWLIAPASFAQLGDSPQATEPREPVQLQLPNKLIQDLSDIAAALKEPPAPEELQLPDDVAEDLREIAAALRKKEVKKSEDPFWNGLERWSWLVGFFLVALAAFYLGVRDSIKAVRREEDAEEARSAQRLIEANDSTGEGKLRQVWERYFDPKRKRIRHWRWLALTTLIFVLGAAGAAGLLALAIVPEGQIWWDEYHLQHAKASAWEVLDTNFAAAFAATWIALLFYGASQMHRLREANGILRIATVEAESIKNLRAERNWDDAFNKYTDIHATIASQSFEIPGVRSEADNEETTKRHVDGFRRIQAVAIARVLNDVELSRNDPLETINAEIRRLKPFVPPQPHMRWFIPWSFATFLGRALELPNLLPKDREEWINLHEALSADIPDDGQIRQRVKALADKLPAAKRVGHARPSESSQ